MKHLVSIYFLTAILCSCSQAKSFRFADFFFGGSEHDSSDTIKRSSEPVELSPKENDLLNTTITLSSGETEVDPTLVINGTSDDEFVDDSSLLNSSSSSSQNSSDVLAEDDAATTKQSVKKQLLVVPPPSTMPVPVTDEQDTFDSMRKSSSVDGLKVTTTNTDEMEEVVLGTTKATAVPDEKTILQKTIEWVKDTYTLSIVVPVAAGVLFATTCIATVALCSCLRRCCRRRRLRKKTLLPDSVKSLRASDRKRLLGDCSSDEEF